MLAVSMPLIFPAYPHPQAGVKKTRVEKGRAHTRMKNLCPLPVVPQNTRFLEILYFELKGEGLFGPAMNGWTSKMAIIRSRRVEINQNPGHRMCICKLYVPRRLFDATDFVSLCFVTMLGNARGSRCSPAMQNYPPYPARPRPCQILRFFCVPRQLIFAFHCPHLCTVKIQKKRSEVHGDLKYAALG